MTRPEGAEDILNDCLFKEAFIVYGATVLPPPSGRDVFYRYLGLKPQAESYCPFGTEIQSLVIRDTGRKHRFEHEDEHEHEDDSISSDPWK